MVVVVDVVVVVVLVLVVVVVVLVVVLVLVDVVLGGIVVSGGASEVVVVEGSGVLIVVVVSVPGAGCEGCVSAASLAAILADVSDDVAAGCVEATLASSVLFVLLEHPDNRSTTTIAVARIVFTCISPYSVFLLACCSSHSLQFQNHKLAVAASRRWANLVWAAWRRVGMCSVGQPSAGV